MNLQRQNSEAKGESSMEDEVDLLLTITENVWVQCDNPDCQKWRKIHKDTAAILEPSITWFCYMNPDKKANDCLKPEDDQVLYEKVAKNAGIKFVMSELEVGDLVWAKTAGYCRWPAVISKDPHLGLHTQLDSDGDPFSYHVEYLGNPHTHCWVYSQHVELYGHKNNKTVNNLKTKMKTCPGTQNKKKSMKKKGKRLTFQYKTTRTGLEDAVEEAESLLNISRQARLLLLVFEHESPGLQSKDNQAPKYGALVKKTESKQYHKHKTKSKSISHKSKSNGVIALGDGYKLNKEYGQRSCKHQISHNKTQKKSLQSVTNSEHQPKIARREALGDEAVVSSNFSKLSSYDSSMYYDDEGKKDQMIKQVHQDTLDIEGLYRIEDFEKMVRDLQDDIEGSSSNSPELTNTDDDCFPLSFNFEDSQVLPCDISSAEESKELSYFAPQSLHPSVEGTLEQSPVILEDMESDLLAMEDYFMGTKATEGYFIDTKAM